MSERTKTQIQPRSEPQRRSSISDEPEETVYDFSLPEVPPERTAELHRQAEYLLDEMAMGAADLSAHAASLPGGRGEAGSAPAETGKWMPGGEVTRGLLKGLDEPSSRVLPDEALPSIRRSSQPAEAEPQAPPPTEKPAEEPAEKPTEKPTEKPREETLAPPAAEETPAPDPDPEPPKPGRLSTPALMRRGQRENLSRATQPPRSSRPRGPARAEVRALEEEIAHLYDEVNRVLATRREITGHALSLLREARTIVQKQPASLGRAEYNVRQVRTMLNRAQESRRQSGRYGLQVLIYLSLWLALIVTGGLGLYLYSDILIDTLAALGGPSSPFLNHLLPLLWAVVTGGGGGVLGAILSLIGHMRAGQEFDRQYAIRYLIQPLMGVVIGASIYGLFFLAFESMELDLTASVYTAALPAAVAFPSGLWQEWIYGILYRMTRLFTLRRRRR